MLATVLFLPELLDDEGEKLKKLEMSLAQQLADREDAVGMMLF